MFTQKHFTSVSACHPSSIANSPAGALHLASLVLFPSNHFPCIVRRHRPWFEPCNVFECAVVLHPSSEVYESSSAEARLLKKPTTTTIVGISLIAQLLVLLSFTWTTWLLINPLFQPHLHPLSQPLVQYLIKHNSRHNFKHNSKHLVVTSFGAQTTLRTWLMTWTTGVASVASLTNLLSSRVSNKASNMVSNKRAPVVHHHLRARVP